MSSDTGDAHLRLTRRVVAGLASAGSLAAAALCALVIAGANVTFDDWPGNVAPTPPGAATVVDTGREPGAPASVRDAAESPAGAAAPPRAAPVDARAGATRRTPRRDRRARGTARRARARAGAPEPAPGPAPVRGGRPPAPPVPARPARDAAVAVAATVRSGGRTAGAVVGRASPGAGAAVTSTTDDVAAQLDAAAEELP